MDLLEELTYMNGLTHYELQNFTSAIECFEKAVEMNENNEVAYYYLAESKISMLENEGRSLNKAIDEIKDEYSKRIAESTDKVNLLIENIFLFKRDMQVLDEYEKVKELIINARKKFPENVLLEVLFHEVDAENILDYEAESRNNLDEEENDERNKEAWKMPIKNALKAAKENKRWLNFSSRAYLNFKDESDGKSYLKEMGIKI